MRKPISQLFTKTKRGAKGRNACRKLNDHCVARAVAKAKKESL